MTWARFQALLGTALLVGCPSTDNAQRPVDGGATDVQTDVPAPDAEAGSDWDPVWHLTEPKQWQTIGPEGQPGCGVGCTMLLDRPAATWSDYAFSYDPWRVLAVGVQIGPLMAVLSSPGTEVLGPVPTQDDSLVEPYVAGTRATFLHNFGAGNGQVEVLDLITGEAKVAYKYTPAQAGTNNVTRTALNSRFAFWAMDGKGLMSRDLQTGEVKILKSGSFLCRDICATEHDLICADLGTIYDVDLDTGKAGYLDNGGALQDDGFCSPDRTQFAWIDYRDPPGQGSTYDFARSGGEVYVRDLVVKKTRRITYDSPDTPHGKNFPVVDGSRVYWNQTPDGPDQNPDQAQTLYGQTTVLVRFDLSTGQKCELPGARVTGFKAAYGSNMVTLWKDPANDEIRVVQINMSDPGLTWQCTTVPVPP